MTTSAVTPTIPQFTQGDRLRKARELTGLSSTAFAERIGVSQKTVNNAEADRVEVRKITLNAWSLATGVPVEWLQTGTAPDGHGPDGIEENAVNPHYLRPALALVGSDAA